MLPLKYVEILTLRNNLEAQTLIKLFLNTNQTEIVKNIYLLLTLVGTLLPLSQFFGFLSEYGLDFESFFTLLFSNGVSAFFALDVIVSAVVLIIFIFQEAKKRHIPYYWVCYIALFSAGVSAALPLFLYLKERTNNVV